MLWATVIVLILCGLATARLTRLVVDDKFPFGPVREATRDRGWIEQLIYCPWCVSAYPSAALVAFLDHQGSVRLPLVAWFFVWWVAVVGYFLAEVLAKYATPEPVKPSGVVDWTQE